MLESGYLENGWGSPAIADRAVLKKRNAINPAKLNPHEKVACGDKTGEESYSKGTGCSKGMFSFRLLESEASYG